MGEIEKGQRFFLLLRFPAMYEISLRKLASTDTFTSRLNKQFFTLMAVADLSHLQIVILQQLGLTFSAIFIKSSSQRKSFLRCLPVDIVQLSDYSIFDAFITKL